MGDPQKYYRLQSLAGRGFYVPDVIPFEEVQSLNQLMLLKNQNNLQTAARSPGKKRKPGQRVTKGEGRPQSLAYQELVPEEPQGAPGAYTQELEYDQMARKGIR